MELKKNDTNKFIYKTGTGSQTQKIYLWLPKGKREGGGRKGKEDKQNKGIKEGQKRKREREREKEKHLV